MKGSSLLSHPPGDLFHICVHVIDLRLNWGSSAQSSVILLASTYYGCSLISSSCSSLISCHRTQASTSPQLLSYYLQAESHTIFPVLGNSAVLINVYVFMKYFDFQPNFPHLKSKLVHDFLLILLFIAIKGGLWSWTNSSGLKASWGVCTIARYFYHHEIIRKSICCKSKTGMFFPHNHN